jgi:hypothetical protein
MLLRSQCVLENHLQPGDAHPGKKLAKKLLSILDFRQQSCHAD